MQNVDFRLDHFTLDVAKSKALDVDIHDSITAGGYTFSIEQAPTVDLTIEDPDLNFLRSETLSRWAWGKDTLDEGAWVTKGEEVDATLDDHHFRLVRVTKNDTSLPLSFEERAVSRLRRLKGAKRASRSKMTRAEFAYSLVKPLGIPFYAPEMHKKQPITSSKNDPLAADDQRTSDGHKGIAPHVHLKVKGEAITDRQRRDIEKALDVADSLDAPNRAVLALLVAGIGESSFKRKAVDHVFHTHKGIWQSDQIPPDDVAQQAHHFLVGGKSFRAGGAIKAAQDNPHWSPGRIALYVEVSDASGPEFYDHWIDEAKAMERAYYGRGGRKGARRQDFVFERKKKESTWDCLQRLATDVNWRCFMRDGRVWFVSEEWLFAQRPAFKIRERRADDPSTRGAQTVDSIDFEIDLFARNAVAEVTVTTRADRWTAIPGMVVEVAGAGPADGRWLVSQIEGDLFDPDVTITLRKPMKEKAEPAAELVQSTSGGGGSQDASSLYSWAKKISDQNRSYLYGGGHGIALDKIRRDDDLDCSSSVSLALFKAGLFNGDTAWVSGDFARKFGRRGEGKTFTVWANADHVWIEFNMKGKRGKRFDTSPHGDGPNGPHMRYTDRSTAGFTPRHLPGM